MKAPFDSLRRILVFQTAFLGDVILTLPLLQMLSRLFREATIDFLAIPTAKNILETIPEINNLIIYDKHGRDKGLLNMFRFVRILRQHQYDLAIVPHRSLRSAVLVWGADISHRVGFHRSAGRLFFNKVIQYPYGIHEINRNLHLLKPFGINPALKIFPRLHFTTEDHRTVSRWLSEHHLNHTDQLICMAPGSVWATKRWLPEYYAKLSDMLNHGGYQVVIIGGDLDRKVADTVQGASHPAPFSAVGRFTLRQSALLIQKSLLLITNDSAPLHLAVAVRTPVIAIFGATVPQFGFFPYGNHDRVMENHRLSCRPCGRHGGRQCPIGTFDCMKTVIPETVLAAAQEILRVLSDKR